MAYINSLGFMRCFLKVLDADFFFTKTYQLQNYRYKVETFKAVLLEELYFYLIPFPMPVACSKGDDLESGCI